MLLVWLYTEDGDVLNNMFTKYKTVSLYQEGSPGKSGPEIAAKVKIADSFGKRLIGLLGTKSLPRGEGLLIVPCKQVHTFFMAYSLDLIFLDESDFILYLVETISPNRISPYISKSRKVLELPASTIKTHGLKIGEKLVFHPRPLYG